MLPLITLADLQILCHSLSKIELCLKVSKTEKKKCIHLYELLYVLIDTKENYEIVIANKKPFVKYIKDNYIGTKSINIGIIFSSLFLL